MTMLGRGVGRSVIRVGTAVAVALSAFLATDAAAQRDTQDQSTARPPATTGIEGTTPPPPGPDGRIAYTIGMTNEAVSVDGVLDEAAWSEAAIIPLAWEVAPAENGTPPVETECRLTQDDVNLYLGCTAHDPDPDRIRAYIVDRDGIGAHDRIVLTLDPFNDQRRAFQFGISALGVQYDAVLAQQGAGNPNAGPDAQPIDPSWDAIWASSGRLTDSGYVIEAAIPFRSLRFPGEAREWGAYLTRWWPRSTNVEVRSAMWDRSDSCVLCQANVVEGVLGGTPGANVQLTPTLTGGRSEVRPGGRTSPLEAQDPDGEFGVDAQWGITSDLTFNLTANPDFSQVEADVAQLDINNRFALFFPEKRPFFMEGADFFGTPIQAVFTRSIADPRAGAKITGKLGDNAVGLLMADDRENRILIPGSQFSRSASLDGGAFSTIARFRRDLGGSSTVGALFTGREGTDYHNRVGGFDAFYRPISSVTLQAQLLRSSTAYPDRIVTELEQPDGEFIGTSSRLSANWNTRTWGARAGAGRTTPDFRADAGFITQAGTRGFDGNLSRLFWGGSDQWFTQLRIEGGFWRTDDFDGNQMNGGIWFGFGYQGPGQLSINVWPNLFMREHFAGTTFDGIEQVFFNVRMAPSGTWSLMLNGNVGEVVDFANARLGYERRITPQLTLRLGRRIETELRHSWLSLNNEGARVFTANLSQVKTVYNFSVRSFLRAIVQYRRTDRSPEQYTSPVDVRSDGFLMQLLYSYKLNPQTVFFLGMSQNGTGYTDIDRLREPLAVQGRTIFLKLGYAWRP